MRTKQLLTFFIAIVIFAACNSNQSNTEKENENMNPFFTEYETPYQVPPFDKIKKEHYMPAFIEGMKQQKKEVAAIINNPEKANFENTIAALDYSGELLTKVSDVFFNITSSMSDDDIVDISKEVSPLLSQHVDDISMNPELFKRIKAVYDTRRIKSYNRTKYCIR